MEPDAALPAAAQARGEEGWTLDLERRAQAARAASREHLVLGVVLVGFLLVGASLILTNRALFFALYIFGLFGLAFIVLTAYGFRRGLDFRDRARTFARLSQAGPPVDPQAFSRLEWTYHRRDERARNLARTAWVLCLAGVLWFVGIFFLIYGPLSCGLGCGGPHVVTSNIVMQPQAATACSTGSSGAPPSESFDVYPISVLSTSATTTTANFGLALTLPGSSTAIAPGTASMAGPGTCPGANPNPYGGWIAVLTDPSGTNEAYWSEEAWTALPGFSVPITLTSSSTFSVVYAEPIAGASLTAWGMGGASVTGSAELA